MRAHAGAGGGELGLEEDSEFCVGNWEHGSQSRKHGITRELQGASDEPGRVPGAPALLGTKAESGLGGTTEPGKQVCGGRELRAANRRGPLTARRVTENLCLQPTLRRTLQRTLRNDRYTLGTLIPSKETSEKFLSVVAGGGGGDGRNTALCPACGLGPQPSYWGAQHRSRCRGQGPLCEARHPEHRQWNPLRRGWHTGAVSPAGDKGEPSLQNQHEYPHGWEACHREQLLLGKLLCLKGCLFTPACAGSIL